ncbi:hypothetical protein [Hyphococcus sp.]|jgi:hypothetical protein|uniref:hypothetical protein n=1 Tax=Hyphococcus sp. TaxID=2038636 RepID=UPI003D13A0D4
MQTLIERNLTAFACLLSAGAAVIALNFPWTTFLSTILVWTALRAPKDFGFGHLVNIPSSRTISDAVYEGLWAAVAIVVGATVLFEGITAVVWASN